MKKSIHTPFVAISKRYLRLVPFFMLALALISLVVHLSRETIQAAWLPSTPGFLQVVAHAFLAQDLLGFEALSSGSWYVAIDFQLYTLLISLCYFLRGDSHRGISLAVAALCVCSMWYFNRIQSLDVYALYFFAAYGLGVLAAWAKRSRFDAVIFWVTVALAIAALLLAYRAKLNVALITAVWLVIKPKGHSRWTPAKRIVHRLANSAYVMFLTHFGVIVWFSAMWHVLQLTSLSQAIAMTFLAWLFSLGLGLVLHEKVEVPLHHWITHHSNRWFLRTH